MNQNRMVSNKEKNQWQRRDLNHWLIASLLIQGACPTIWDRDFDFSFIWKTATGTKKANSHIQILSYRAHRISRKYRQLKGSTL